MMRIILAVSGLLICAEGVGCSELLSRQKVVATERCDKFPNPTMDDLPQLLNLLRSESCLEDAEVAISKIGEPALPHLFDLLHKDESSSVQHSAAWIITDIGPSAIPGLLECLKDNSYDHNMIIGCLKEIRPTSSEAVEAIIESLNKEETVSQGLYALRSFVDHEKATKAIPTLKGLIRHSNPKINNDARELLWLIDFEVAWDAGLRDGPHKPRLIKDK